MSEAPQSSGKSGIEEEAKDVSIADRKEEVRSVGEIESYFSAASYRKGQREGAMQTSVEQAVQEEKKKAITFFGKESFRKGQKETIEEIERAFLEGYRYVLLEGPTGSGKSEIAACFARQSESCHVLTVQKVLQDQYKSTMPDFAIMKGRGAYRCIHNLEGGYVSCAKGVCRRKKRVSHADCPYKVAMSIARDAQITVHNFDSFYFQNKGFAFNTRDLLVVDECFIPSTKVLTYKGEKPISEVEVGDSVLSFDEVKTKFVFNKVVNVYKRQTALLYRVSVEGKDSVYCTSNHLFFTSRGWVKAANLLLGVDFVYNIMYNTSKGNAYGKERAETKLKSSLSLFRSRVYLLWKKLCMYEYKQDFLLSRQVEQNILFGTVCKDDEVETYKAKSTRFQKRESKAFAKDEKKQPYVLCRNKREGKYDVESNKPQAKSSRWQWKTSLCSSVFACICSWLGYGSSGVHKSEKRIGISFLLQDRCSKRDVKSGYRGRWHISLFLKGKRKRQEEGSLFKKSRVEDIEILEQGGSGEFGKVCPEGCVYDLEVANFHTYTANGFIVHNCHNVENKFLNFVSFTVSNRKDPSLNIPKLRFVKDYTDFLKQYEATVESEILVYDNLAEEAILTTDQLKRLDDLQDLYSKLQMYFNALDNVEYVFDYREYKEGHKSVMFRPVYVKDFVLRTLFPYGRRALLMSATILDKKIFCKSVGLDLDSVHYISTPSYFLPENRPIYKKYAGSMSYKDIALTLPKMLDAIRSILAKHPARRGIIHTANERVASYIQNNLFDTRLTFRRQYRTVDDMLSAHRAKSNSFIVASGLKEGLDLYDDLSRVQVLAKIPYPDLSDKRVQRRKELEKDWYGYQTVLLFVQSLGRSIRSETDRAITYILDENFERFYKWNRKFIPEYVRKAIKK